MHIVGTYRGRKEKYKGRKEEKIKEKYRDKKRI